MWHDQLPQNVRQTLQNAIELTKLEDERTQSVLQIGVMIGERRAKLLHRKLRPREDVPFVLTAWCWWPFKVEADADVQEALRAGRRVLLQDVEAGRVPAHSMSDDLLQIRFSELLQLLETGEIIGELGLRDPA